MEPNAHKPSPNGARVRRIRSGELARGLVGRLLNPTHLWTAAQLHRLRRVHRHDVDDAMLELYGKLLPDGFFHYGYFDDTSRKPEEMPFNDISRAQIRYAQVLLEHVTDRSRPVLDVGCGMGGLCRMLAERGFEPVALTPDRLQATHVAATLPNVPVIRSKFETILPAEHARRYGTVITAESLQYLKLDRAMPLMSAIVAPGGRWIVCDYFRLRTDGDHSCHAWDDFRAQIQRDGWRITHERDITPNILPALAFIHLWLTRVGLPLMQLGVLRLKRKQPGMHHLLRGVLDVLEDVADDNLKRVDPEWFAANRRYLLVVLDKES